MSLHGSDLIYPDMFTDYLEFVCGKYGERARIVRIGPNEPSRSTDLKNITILGIDTECPRCHQEGFIKINLLGVKVGSEE